MAWQKFRTCTHHQLAQRPARQNRHIDLVLMKEVSLLEMIGRSLAKVAAGAGVAALLIWITYVMLDFGHMQSGFTLPQSTY